MKLTGLTNSGINLFDVIKSQGDTTGKINVLSQDEIEANRLSNSVAVTDVDAYLTKLGKEQIEKSMQSERQRINNYYAADETLEYAPGNYSLSTEIALAITTGNGYISEDGSVHNAPKSFGDPLTDSPMIFKQQINNLRALYESYGADAAKYDDEFNAALDKVLANMFENGGAFINADKEGVADSIHAMLRGEEGKYTADDMSAMIALSQQSKADSLEGASEFELGALLGYEALSITALHNNGKLSDNAYKTVWSTFEERVDAIIKQADAYIEHAKQDSYGNKKTTYSPINKELVREAISVMMSAIDDGDFNKGIRRAIGTLADKYDSRREAQREAGVFDQRYSSESEYGFLATGAGASEQRSQLSNSIIYGSQAFSQYFDIPDFSLQGNLLGKLSAYV